MEFENVKGIIWDLDGTLVDSFELTLDILGEMVAEKGLQMPSRYTLMKNYHAPLTDIFVELFDAKDREVAELMDSFNRKQGKHYAGNTDHHFYDDAVRLAKESAKKNIAQFIVTNRVHDCPGSATPRDIIDSSALANHFVDIKCRDEVVVNKPDARALEGWFDAHGIDHNDLLVIGDTHVDADLALNIGARAILIDRHKEGMPQELSDRNTDGKIFLVEDLHDIQIS